MREIKFQYVWKHESSFAFGVYGLDEIDNGNPVAPKTKGKFWDLISRRQFTGLKDKNGIEIYEGDVVRDSNFLDGVNHYIYFDEKLGGWFMCDKSDYIEMLSDYLSSCKVIGNIHQNPELLK